MASRKLSHKENKMSTSTSKSAVTPSATELEQQIAALLDKKAVSTGSKNLAAEFEKIARANGGVVTYAQAKAIVPKSPSDLSFYFRQAGGKCVTTRNKAGQSFWTVVRPIGYPGEVKAEVERLTQELSKVKK
jgi:hypothetical protein